MVHYRCDTCGKVFPQDRIIIINTIWRQAEFICGGCYKHIKEENKN